MGYAPPSTERLRSLQMDKVKQVKAICSQIIQKRVMAATLSVDGWSCATGSYFGVILHYIDPTNWLQTPMLLAVVCILLPICCC